MKSNKLAQWVGDSTHNVWAWTMENWHRIIIVACLVSITLSVSTMVHYTEVIGQRVLDFTQWYHNYVVAQGSPT